MIKKILSILLVLVLALTVASCGQGSASESTTPATTLPTEIEENPDIPPETEEVLIADEGSVPIVLSLPISLISKQELHNFDWEAFAQENGFIAAEVTEDGNVSVTLTEERQTELLNQLSVDMDNMIATYVKGEATPYIQDILYSGNYSVFTVKVDTTDYKASFDFASTLLGQKALEYQLYSGNAYIVTVSIIDAVSGNVIHDFKYPEA